MIVKEAVLEADVTTQHHLDVLKRLALAWEAAPHWQIGQLINYLQNFCEESELYNLPDTQIMQACDAIVGERDSQAQKAFITKPLLIAKFNPKTRTAYLTAAKTVLIKADYEKVLNGILYYEHYEVLPLDLRTIVDSYYAFDE